MEAEEIENVIYLQLDQARPIELLIQHEILTKVINNNNGSASGHTHTQSIGAQQWVMVHSFGYRPSVSITDESGEEMIGDIRHVSLNEVHIFFSQLVTGKAYLI